MPLATSGRDGCGRWLLVRRSLDNGELAYYLCWGPAETSLAGLGRVAGARWSIEQGYKQVKHELGWADFQVRSARAIRRHLVLVACAFSFCWYATRATPDARPVEPAAAPDPPSAVPARPAGSTAARGASGSPPSAVDPAAAWPQALRRVRAWLIPWRELQRLWRAWSSQAPPPVVQHRPQLTGGRRQVSAEVHQCPQRALAVRADGTLISEEVS